MYVEICEIRKIKHDKLSPGKKIDIFMNGGLRRQGCYVVFQHPIIPPFGIFAFKATRIRNGYVVILGSGELVFGVRDIINK